MARIAAATHASRDHTSQVDEVSLGWLDSTIFQGVSMLVHASELSNQSDPLGTEQVHDLALRLRNSRRIQTVVATP